MDDSTFWSEIIAVTDGEPIEAVVIGTLGGNYGADENDPRDAFPDYLRNTPIGADEAGPLLDYDYHRGYGAADCHATFVYTTSRIIFVREYDGATGIAWVPRYPVAGPVDLNGLDKWSDR